MDLKGCTAFSPRDEKPSYLTQINPHARVGHNVSTLEEGVVPGEMAFSYKAEHKDGCSQAK